MSDVNQAQNDSKLVIIMRGLPGSGKSYWVEQFIQSQPLSVATQIKQYGYYSTDNLFFNDGEYRFDINKLSQNHQLNLSLFIEALARAEPVVICDNTNVCHWEYLAYKTAAVALGYQVKVVLIGDPKSVEHQELCSQRNKHSVSLKQIQRMAKLFEID
ncbi:MULTISPECIES: AAA family ATPase [Shewanella]|uniref:ATP-binding protein n=1 Tax=Shewanella holmiensis TaxID=2952222 RepID=A0A9X3AVK7_9GAMM|nr:MULTISPECIES: ATP-binding protein [Shewanella]MCT7941493.1 ATP-binding protein [Shewanella holmiensis]MDP5145429.1 ATP-binding protein [Shewanella sp. ULN5]